MRHIPVRTLGPLVAVIGLVGCASENPVQPNTPRASVPTPVATVPPAPATTQPPATQPTPEPDPSRNNRPPTVTLTGGGSCHPSVNRPCTVEFQAQVLDREGDAYSLRWEGCASGTGFTETCTIARPGDHTATVVVTDARGAVGRASATARGTNLAPIVRIGLTRPPDPAPANTFFPIIGDEPYDPDDWPPYNNLACPTARVTGSGACRATLAWCGGVGNAFDIDVRTTGPGTCTVEATVTDPWGAVGRDRFSFRVLAP